MTTREIYRVNLFKWPLWVNAPFYGSATRAVEDGVLTITLTGGDSYAIVNFTGLVPGERYVWSVDVRSDTTGGPSTQLFETNWTPVASDSTANGRARIAFTAPSNGMVMIRFDGINREEGSSRSFSRPQLELESTWDESLPFFYYGTMPYPRSA